MEEVFDQLFVGDDEACVQRHDDWAVVHACKHPCHQDAVGYTGNLPQSHAEYLVAERETDLYLNLVDMRQPLDHEYTGPIMTAALDFIEDRIPSQNVLVHCNQGVSRSPAIALLYLAKRAGEIPNSGYRAARDAFREQYPRFQPGHGVAAYLEANWDALE